MNNPPTVFNCVSGRHKFNTEIIRNKTIVKCTCDFCGMVRYRKYTTDFMPRSPYLTEAEMIAAVLQGEL